MLKVLPVALLGLAACSDLPGPSVPSQSGQTLMSARYALQECGGAGPGGGDGAVFGSYVGGVVLGGIIIGPVVVAMNEDNIRAHGEAGAVDRCLAKKGFKRRDLTPQEVSALNSSSPAVRLALLNHLVGGGSLATFNGT